MRGSLAKYSAARLVAMRPRGVRCKKAALHQVGFIDVFQGVFLFAQGRGQGAQAHRPAVVLLQDGEEDLAVHAVEAQLVHVQQGEGGVGAVPVDAAVALTWA